MLWKIHSELTVDVSLHITSTKDNTEELHAVCEIPYGRQDVDKAFVDSFKTLVGKTVC